MPASGWRRTTHQAGLGSSWFYIPVPIGVISKSLPAFLKFTISPPKKTTRLSMASTGRGSVYHGLTRLFCFHQQTDPVRRDIPHRHKGLGNVLCLFPNHSCAECFGGGCPRASPLGSAPPLVQCGLLASGASLHAPGLLGSAGIPENLPFLPSAVAFMPIGLPH